MEELTKLLNRLLSERIVPLSVDGFNKGYYRNDYKLFENRSFYQEALSRVTHRNVEPFTNEIKIEVGQVRSIPYLYLVFLTVPNTGTIGQSAIIGIVIDRRIMKAVSYNMELSFRNYVCGQCEGGKHFNYGNIADRSQFLKLILSLAKEELTFLGKDGTGHGNTSDKKPPLKKEPHILGKHTKRFGGIPLWMLSTLGTIIVVFILILIYFSQNKDFNRAGNTSGKYSSNEDIKESTEWLYEYLTNKGCDVGKNVQEFDSLVHCNSVSRKWVFERCSRIWITESPQFMDFWVSVTDTPFNDVLDYILKSSQKNMFSVPDVLTGYSRFGLDIENDDNDLDEIYDEADYTSSNYSTDNLVKDVLNLQAIVVANSDGSSRARKKAPEDPVYEEPIDIKNYSNGQMPYADWFGKGKYDGKSLSYLTIENYSSLDAVVLLVAPNGSIARHSYVNRNSSYTMNQIPAGSYIIKVMMGNQWNSLKDNGQDFPQGGFQKNVSFSKSLWIDKFDFNPVYVNEGVDYPTYSVTLHGVKNGNFQTAKSSSKEFFKI